MNEDEEYLERCGVVEQYRSSTQVDNHINYSNYTSQEVVDLSSSTAHQQFNATYNVTYDGSTNVTYEGHVDMSNATVILPQYTIDDGVFTSLINDTPARSEVREIVKEVLREMVNSPY